METLLRWIHISDIHMGHGGVPGRWDQELVLNHLLRDVERQRKAQPEPPVDCIFVTGDIANTGGSVRADEYAKADEWLAQVAAAAGVSRKEVFVVPGNHDVDRGVDTVDAAVGALITELRNGKLSIDVALGDAGKRALLAKRMERYLAFARAFADPGAGDGLTWVHRFTAKSGLPVRLVGLNTALLAADNFDQGKLQLGRSQLGEASKDLHDDELVVALAHHPSTEKWLADEGEIAPHLKGTAHALLTGHVHIADAEQTRAGSGTTFLRVVAGSAHGDAMPPGIPAGHGYSFGAVVRGDGDRARLRIWPRRWVEKLGHFKVDADNTPDGQTYSDHELPATLTLPARGGGGGGKGGGPTPGETIPVFISTVAADDFLRKELEKQLVTLRRSKYASFANSVTIAGGADARASLDAELQKARIVLLLVSSDYVASDAAYEDEVLRAVERHAAGTARVIPIILNRCNFTEQPFSHLQHLPRLVAGKNGAPDKVCVSDYPTPDGPLAEIAREITDLVYQMRGEAPKRGR